MSGLIADAKTLIDKARVETQVRLDIYHLKTIALVSGLSQKSLAWEDCYSKGAGVEWEACEERSFLHWAFAEQIGGVLCVVFFLFGIAHLLGILWHVLQWSQCWQMRSSECVGLCV